jgi:hypothetical protein
MFEKSRLLPEPPPNPPKLGDSGIKVPQFWGLSACGKQEKGAVPEHLILFKHPLRLETMPSLAEDTLCQESAVFKLHYEKLLS